MSKKFELRVQIFCEKCKATIWKTASKLDGVKSISLDEEKGVLTVTGSADAVEMVEKLRKAKICAEILSLGPEKKEEKKEEKKDKNDDEEKDDKKDEKKKIECVPVCYCNYGPCHCNYKQPYGYRPVYGYPMPQVVYVDEQYPAGNCAIS